MSALVRLSGVNKSYDVGGHVLHVLKDLDFEVGEGELVAIMGASGSGKSTLLNILGILDDYDIGRVPARRHARRRTWPRRRPRGYRNRFIGFVFQSFHLIPFKTAVENVALPALLPGHVAREAQRASRSSYLERVGLAEWADHLPSELSGGQKQRVAIARALVTQAAADPRRRADGRARQRDHRARSWICSTR